ncbi:class I SAM-dependent methyltransferase [Melghirimyces algeriensis]|uniref:rRNA methylase n=1 Tax=Melghirimyces algeriensis TaxID=910412 RepID=A0A521DN93_9BACL|nr:class I SAM-dependent methyltransferase [Melghirimyces algeriensis]SMO73209.1 Putative rRNA methylase [Melghirimyces algeriensis]
MSFPSTLAFAHDLVKGVLFPGAYAVDATLGNGQDTLFLAQGVGPEGQVHGFDIQKEALDRTENRLHQHGMVNRVTLHQNSHHQMEQILPPKWKGNISAVMFNLGYLPKGDPAIITKPETTIHAFSQALKWLAPGGILTAVLYTGHTGGLEEAKQVLNYIKTLKPNVFHVIQYQTLNRHHAPSLIAVQKSKKHPPDEARNFFVK